ncbi:MAG: winged helix-turn-helix transcriptional regulator [Pirellulales bacterium]|nr:winged helix-turn-helix transcriptional regulator [Pirellulales bacterium]
MTGQQPRMNGYCETSDRMIVDYLRRHAAASIADLVAFTGVTATAVRQRLTRLMEQGLITRQSEAVGRGRPSHRYSLTPAGARSGGNNFDLLARVLWEEVRDVRDPEVRQGLLKRVAQRMAESYRAHIHGVTINERMAELVDLMAGQQMPFEVEESNSLPVLTALSCPYPGLAEEDRGVCAMEKLVFSDVLGENVRLSACRLDGANCCTFETSGAATT